MNALREDHRPKSDDPDFWDVWSGQDEKGKPVERIINWKEIADDWQQIKNDSQTEDNTDSGVLDDDIPF